MSSEHAFGARLMNLLERATLVLLVCSVVGCSGSSTSDHTPVDEPDSGRPPRGQTPTDDPKGNGVASMSPAAPAPSPGALPPSAVGGQSGEGGGPNETCTAERWIAPDEHRTLAYCSGFEAGSYNCSCDRPLCDGDWDAGVVDEAMCHN